MDGASVVAVTAALERDGVPVWIDGGWCVDALLGRQTRAHGDLDIAVEARLVPVLIDTLRRLGFDHAPRADATPWNFVLAHADGRQIDVHAFAFDSTGAGVLGPAENGDAYPAGALDGEGAIEGVRVRCIAGRFMLQFKTAHGPRDIDRADIAALRARFG
jgi:lincosamide nucleotidyltransferase A/C/D/E